MNTLQYGIKAEKSEIGPEAEDQFQWLEENLKEAQASGRKFILISHIYAGARVNHDDTQSVSSMWDSDYNSRYFDLLLAYKDQVMLEVGGHDHWEDIRVYKNKHGDIYRNLIIATGVGLDHGQLPGFNTLKVAN